MLLMALISEYSTTLLFFRSLLQGSERGRSDVNARGAEECGDLVRSDPSRSSLRQRLGLVLEPRAGRVLVRLGIELEGLGLAVVGDGVEVFGLDLLAGS